MKNLILEVAQEADYQIIADIYNQYINNADITMDERNFEAKDIKNWVEKLNNREKLFVVKKQGNIIAWAIIKCYSDRLGYAKACETSVYLRQEEIGKGYGTIIKKELIEVCKDLKYHHLVDKIVSNNEISIACSKKIGYEIVGIQKEIGYKNGKWIDIVIMQYIIED